MEWIQANWGYIVAVLLAVSELLAVIPQFKGNGFLDTIIKVLKTSTTKVV